MSPNSLCITALLLALLGACHEEREGYVLVHETPGEAQPCPEPQEWTAVVRKLEPGCGIAFGDDAEERLADALAQASGGDESEYAVHDSSPDRAFSVVAAIHRSESGWHYAYAGFSECEPSDDDVREALESCDDCEVECEDAMPDCESTCCESPTLCGPESPCCPGELCVDGPPKALTLDGEAACVPKCSTDVDCGAALCCRDVEGTEVSACLPCD